MDLEMLAVGETHGRKRAASGDQVPAFVDDAQKDEDVTFYDALGHESVEVDRVPLARVLVPHQRQDLVRLAERAHRVLLDGSRKVRGLPRGFLDLGCTLFPELGHYRDPEHGENNGAERDD